MDTLPDRPTLGDRILALGAGPAGPVLLVALALLEATVFPGPTEAMLVALILVRRESAWWLAGVATGASVAGGIAGYHLGAFLFAEVAQPLLANLGLLAQMGWVSRLYRENAMLALITSGYTPVPYMLYTMTAGVSEIPLSTFAVGSFLGRGLKYVPIAVLAFLFGPAVTRILRRYGWAVAFAILILTVAFIAMNH